MSPTVPPAITATIEPPVSNGFRRARHVVEVHNNSDAPVSVDIGAEDPDLLLELHVDPTTMVIEPASSGRARVRVRVLPGWPAGEDRSRRFRVTARAAGQAPVTVSAQMHLRALPRRPDRTTLAALIAVPVVVVAAVLAAGRGGDGPAQPVAASGATTLTTVAAVAAPASPDGTDATPPAPGPTTTPTPTTAATATSVAGGSPSSSVNPPSTAAGPPAAAGPAAAIAAGAVCRTTSALRVEGRMLTNGDGSFVRRFGDDSTAFNARNLLARRAMFCTIGNAAADDAELVFFPPPVDPTPAVAGSKCTSRYVPETLVKSRQGDTFVIEVGLAQYLFYAREEDRDRAFTLLRGHNQICWVGGGAEDIFSNFFDWTSAVTYF